jgi:outer membrane protein assembly factor BamB
MKNRLFKSRKEMEGMKKREKGIRFKRYRITRYAFSFSVLAILALIFSTPPLNADDWPMFRHDLNNSGYTAESGPVKNDLKWKYNTHGLVHSSPAIRTEFGHRYVYVGSNSKAIYRLNALTGKCVSSCWIGAEVWSSPALQKTPYPYFLYVGADDSYVHCWNSFTTVKEWKYYLYEDVYSSPALSDTLVYVGSLHQNKLYCLKYFTIDPNGELVWVHAFGGQDPSVYSSPAVVDDKVYVGSTDSRIHCVNAATGDSIWSYATGGPVYSSPAVVDGKVYVGSDDNKVYCLNATTGVFGWAYSTRNWVRSSPAVAAGKIYVGSDDSTVYCLRATDGLIHWTFKTGGCVRSSPAVADTLVYVGSDDSCVYCLPLLDPSGGNVITADEVIWSYKTGDMVRSSPAVVGSVLYVGSYDSTVYAFGKPDTGACCLLAVDCVDGLTRVECEDQGGTFMGAGTTCDEVQCPTLTEWGLIVLVVLIVFSTWVVLRRRRKVLSHE